ncbi:hypothetical protein B9Q13_02505 [Candidatus Marsarchaeota G2 archaeon ECH_B_SAG-G16]|jgi:sulfide:quinone oxidoreductase|uniref:FAD/NAD(P)-binding domain-containing protein n=3 Tax=Candidatus Marsarchaeota TaxID=1978152 RepID=A0A2R6AGW4_9ARCH|nr:MAG: hypothetical protein B9Q01_00970 [Candidatus Marsarchaeota G1 archaeon OSP_D]PSN85631.1 MAG: hypothetical protein B9Q02_05455 [Candidatus Marsarchaeota G1 archaeon BE_D]PSO05200.1 MAG: hypothetical protein B9Q13_02505 [Candidatus Marsarchaeota G2 archaeon ECH_B_SAG-G16]
MKKRQHVLILGGGVGGVATAVALRKSFDVTLVTESDFINYALLPKLFVENLNYLNAIIQTKILSSFGIQVYRDTISLIIPSEKKVKTKKGKLFTYDYLIIALGAEVPIAPHFWSIEGFSQFQKEAVNFKGGKLVIAVEGIPYRCPPAPFDIAYRLKRYFESKSLNVQTIILHPEAKPLIAVGEEVHKKLIQGIEREGIELKAAYHIKKIDPIERKIENESGELVNYDLLMYVPKHKAPNVVSQSELSTNDGWLNVKKNFRTEKYDDIFGVGDIIAPTLGLPMAAFLALYEAQFVSSLLTNQEPPNKAEAACPIEMGSYSFIPFCDFRSKIENGLPPKCKIIEAEQNFIGFFRNLIHQRLLSLFSGL